MSAHGPFDIKGLKREGLSDENVLNALKRVPRHCFVPRSQLDFAYEDRALPIGKGQTISQPYIVGLMTQHAGVFPGARVLEVGTGSGYQSVVLAELGAEVFTVEIVKELSLRAVRLMRDLGYDEIHARVADGWYGWQEKAPFDAIVVTAACPRVPLALVNQLRDGARMVLPLEREGEAGEKLVVVTRHGEGHSVADITGVRFVPMTGDARQMLH